MTSREAVLAAIQPFRARLRGLRARNLPPGLRSLALFFVLLGVPGVAKDTGVLSDPRDGHTYRTVAIGRQTWMAENLNHETPDSWCYDDDPAHCAACGRLYTWEAARTACPAGWHLPSEAEWFALERHLGMTDEEVLIFYDRGEGQGTKLKSEDGWASHDDTEPGNDETGVQEAAAVRRISGHS